MKQGKARADSEFRRTARLFSLAIVIVLLGVMPALAAKRDCEASQTDMNLCAIAKSKTAEAKMNRFYQKLMNKVVEEKNKVRLREAQEAWSIYRQKQCEFATAGSEGGSVLPMLISDCYRGMANARIKEIEADLNCEEGVAGCGGQ
jgi:uncharacterized protein YecT (DUF1311 family)